MTSPSYTAEEEPMHGIGDLAVALGGSEDSFTGKLLLLIAKADPGNRERLRKGFPRIVYAWELWMTTSPTPTAAQLLALLPCTCPRVDVSTVGEPPGTSTVLGLDPGCPVHGGGQRG